MTVCGYYSGDAFKCTGPSSEYRGMSSGSRERGGPLAQGCLQPADIGDRTHNLSAGLTVLIGLIEPIVTELM